MTTDAAAPFVVHVRALGATVAIEVPDERLRLPVEQAWSACRTEAVPGAPGVRPPSLSPAAGPDEKASALQSLTQSVTREAILARSGELMMFHAAALSDQSTGATIAMVAPGGTGKTTLVRALGPGRGYVTDETVGVAADGAIAPYCKPLSVRREHPRQPKDEISPGTLGLCPPRVEPWLAGLVLLRRDRAAGERPVVEDVGVLDALVQLAPETSSLAAFDRPLHRLAELVESVGGLRRIRYHSVDDVEPVVREVLGRSR
ncbi:hypothetical protein [Terrabacter sp. C0L_2]|uniref:hypothetical protein n=1 Tax=Terrabacter sp. C0L_2 TaxID=3108389 RepID=UPI002ED09C83|nr:hypothetical protein U5C87_11010 [Terrabacter sp. C0L_2]